MSTPQVWFLMTTDTDDPGIATADARGQLPVNVVPPTTVPNPMTT